MIKLEYTTKKHHTEIDLIALKYLNFRNIRLCLSIFNFNGFCEFQNVSVLQKLQKH